MNLGRRGRLIHFLLVCWEGIWYLDDGRREEIYPPSANRSSYLVRNNTAQPLPTLTISVFARVVLSLALLSIQPQVGIVKSSNLRNRISYSAWPAFAALSWGSVMWLFRWYPETIQTGLKSSMDYIYVQSDHWDSLRTFLTSSESPV